MYFSTDQDMDACTKDYCEIRYLTMRFQSSLIFLLWDLEKAIGFSLATLFSLLSEGIYLDEYTLSLSYLTASTTLSVIISPSLLSTVPLTFFTYMVT